MRKVDYLIVGAGFYGSILAYNAKKKGYKCLVIDKRNHIAGNCYTSTKDNIDFHKYGPHIFHTDDKEVWEFINKFTEFNNYINSPLAVYKNKLYNLPFNMNTFYQLFNTYNIDEINAILIKEKEKYKNINPSNLEEQALKLVGDTVYNTLIKGYTEKQWGRNCTDLPAFIIKRLPVRYTFDNNYFNDRFQGIPINGYTPIFEKLLEGIEVKLDTTYKEIKDKIQYKKLIYTGMIDEFYDFCFGKLEYRSLNFKHKTLDTKNYQGNAVINYTEKSIPYTRIIEHKHFNKTKESDKTIISYEYSEEYNGTNDAYYPIGLNKNKIIYNKYKELSKENPDIIFGGRLGDYAYYDMDDIIRKALDKSEEIFN
tara:strand:+ start:5297 stop:6397 length:1101 start_codon:yes stop_codon:yes gene_type:complete